MSADDLLVHFRVVVSTVLMVEGEVMRKHWILPRPAVVVQAKVLFAVWTLVSSHTNQYRFLGSMVFAIAQDFPLYPTG